MQQFLILWLGQLLSLVGSQLTGFALGVWVYQQTHSTILFALLMGLNILPIIVLSPVVGVIADRWNRRQVMLFSDFGAGLSTVALAIAIQTHYLPIPLIALLITLNATFSSFMRPAYMAATTQLVDEKHLDRASGLMQVGVSAAQLVAPVLGGVLLKTAGLPGVLWIDVITFVIAVITQSIVRIPSLPRPSSLAQTGSLAQAGLIKQSFAKESLQAFDFLGKRPGLLALLSFFVVKNFLGSIVYVLTTPYILSFASEVVLGSILSVGGLGMVVGSIILSLLPESRSRIHTLIAFCLLSGFTLIGLGFSHSILAFMVGSFLFFLGLPFLHGSGQVIFQKKVPENLQGRVFAFNEAVAGCAVPLGYLAAGPLSEFIFEPLLQPDGALSGSLGLVLGIGTGRGIALLFVVLGLCHSVLAALVALYPPLYHVEKLLPDALRQPATPSATQPEVPIAPVLTAVSNLQHLEQEIVQNNRMELPAPIEPFLPVQKSDRPTLPSPMQPVISIQNLNYYFGKGDLTKQILFEINFSIYPGEIVIMTGPSGSGKTTLLTLIGGLRSVKSGSVTVLGRELTHATNRQLVQVRRNIGYIFQGHNLLPFMTARQNVRMSLSLHNHASPKQALQRVDRVLNAVDLGDHINYYPAKLSGGQKQRVAIARALVNEPALILADEPTASLDSKTGRDVVELMYRLAKEQNCTILLVTHDNRILDIADRIIHLEDGKLQTISERSNLLESDRQIPNHLSDQHSTALTAPAIDAHIASEIPPEIIPETPSEITQASPDPLAKIYKIACISDSLTTLYTLKAFLYDDIFSVILIQDPIQALTEILKASPDLVIMDLVLPKLDGYQVCALLRQHKVLLNIPVIVMIDSPKDLNAEQAKISGITDSLVKPFDQTNLIVKLFPHLQ